MLSSRKFCVAVIIVLLVGVAVTISAVVLTESDTSTNNRAIHSPRLDTPVGIFKGTPSTSSMNGRSYLAYKGIPFARPPVGDLRFARPVPAPQTVEGQIVNPFENRDSCWSATKTSTSKYYGEDCLYLNIYTPTQGSSSTEVYSGPPLPVMVWLHGGGFVAGTVYPEPIKLVTRGEVIVVMVNYRLGVFGFLTTMDDHLPSNNGLFDQYMAIKWVSENIQHFCGDPDSITVFGHSAGSISVALHAISPLTSPYFQKAILQSGAATALLARNPIQRATDFSQLVGCGQFSINTPSLAQCLRNISIHDILENGKPSSFNIPQARRQADFIWMPVVDGEIIADEPLKLLSNHSYMNQVAAYNKDFLIGVLNNEGAIINVNFFNPISLTDLTQVEFFNDLRDYLILMRYGANSNQVRARIRRDVNAFYLGEEVINSAINSESVLKMASDLLFTIPATEMAIGVSRCSSTSSYTCPALEIQTNSEHCPAPSSSSRTFFYHFDMCPPKDPCKPPCMIHGDEYSYVFPKRNFTDQASQDISDQFVDLLTSFARDSNPRPLVSTGWPVFEPSSQSYLNLGPNPSVRRFLYNSRSTFWLKRVPDLLK